jgi:hypothetical protein
MKHRIGPNQPWARPRKGIRLRDLPRHKSLPVLWHCGLLGEKGSANAENRNGGTRATWESEGDNDRNTARADSPPECTVEREGRLSHGAAGETMEPVHVKSRHMLAFSSRSEIGSFDRATPGAQGSKDSTSAKRSPWAAPAPDAPSLRPRRMKAMPTASTAPASGPAT